MSGVVAVGRDVTVGRRAGAQLDAALGRQKALAELCRQGLRGVGLSSVLERATARLAGVLAVDYASVLELQPRGKEFRIACAYGDGVQRLLGATVSAGPESQAGHALGLYRRTEAAPLGALQAVAYEDFSAQPFYATSPNLRELGVTSGMSVVIPGLLRPYGVLSAYSRARRDRKSVV